MAKRKGRDQAHPVAPASHTWAAVGRWERRVRGLRPAHHRRLIIIEPGDDFEVEFRPIGGTCRALIDTGDEVQLVEFRGGRRTLSTRVCPDPDAHR